MLTKENIRINLNNESFYVTTEETMLELENKINKLEVALNILIISFILETVVLVIPTYISLITKGF